ncbi:2-dehydropantoate 2-reductase [Marinobacter pelagius]|uniref:ketopantoate reductase family protein n=1 Tax=Marinobacter sp. C7 TaxID=2951363 RepID=UPI001EEFB5EA|nr:2-dehydropantoate 2-reductase [Marinobacter sp. C7]MCG7199984.1 2-dehydropantoate 2-reductase [Marinobacter sp. C7]
MIGILGAGSLGRLWAALLPQDQVAFLPRPDADPAPALLSYSFESIQGSQRSLALPWLQQPDDLSLLLVTTKAGDTLTALQHWLPKIPESVPIVLFQNGLGSQQAVADTSPQRPILAASTTEGANRPDPNRLVHAGSGETWVGALTPRARPELPGVVAQLATTGLVVHAEDQILVRLWQKLVVNAGINPFTAILDCPNGDILANDFFQRHIDPLCREIAGLMAAEGIGDPTAGELRQRIETVARNTARNTSSMRGDILNRRTTEIDFINGYLVQLGQRLDIPTPVNQLLTDRVKQLSPHKESEEFPDGQSPFEDLHPHRG